MEDNPDIGVAAGNRLKHVTVLDAEPPWKCHSLAAQDRFRRFLANQGLQCGDGLVPGARLAFARHNNADGAACQIVESLNGERVAGGDQQAEPSVSGKNARLGLDDRSPVQLSQQCCAAHDDIGIEPARPAHFDGEVAERDPAAEQHPDDYRLRQGDDQDVVQRQSGILRLRPGPGAERLNDLAAEESRKMTALGKDGQTDRRAETSNDVGTVSV